MAVTVEVLGPLVLSVLAGRGAARWLWAGLALGGVVLLGRDGVGGLDPLGLAFAAGAATMWAAAIRLTARAGRALPEGGRARARDDRRRRARPAPGGGDGG